MSQHHQNKPAPAPDELEAPEVVAVLYKSGDVLTAEECGIALEVCAKVETPLMTVAQHNRIVASLTRPTQTGQHIHTAGQRLYEELRQWLATEHDPDSQAALQAWREAIAQTAPQHPDDEAVDRFATAMKVKLAAARAKGRGGWDDPSVCSVEFLAQLLVEHLGKGNAGTFEDVANFAMMLHQRGADPTVLANATRPAQTEQQPVAWVYEDGEVLLETDFKWNPHRTRDGAHPLYAAPIAQTVQQPEQSGLVEALEAIVRQYPNPDISHVDYRVHACRQAEQALGAYRAALPNHRGGA